MTSQTLSMTSEKLPIIRPIQFRIYTHAALQLFQGSWRPGKLGLLQCAHYLKEVHRAAQSGHAEAVLYLHEIEKRMKQLYEKFNAIEENFQFKLDGLRSFLFDMHATPIHIAPCHFSNTLCFCITRLIEQIDYLVRQYAILKRFQCLEQDTSTPRQWMSEMQHLFMDIKTWYETHLKMITHRSILVEPVKLECV